MRLDYLLFDVSDEESGSCSFDALASVLPERLPSLLREVEAVLGWASREFGEPAGDEGEWTYDLQATAEGDVALDVAFDGKRARVAMPARGTRVTLALTVGGSAAFSAAFRERFPEAA